jgi:hypothetical protein
MKPFFAMMALAGALATSLALAQAPAPVSPGSRPTNMTGGGLRPVTTVPPLSASPTVADSPPSSIGALARPTPTATDRRIYEEKTSLPAPNIPDQEVAPGFALPTDPIEPYLLTRAAGPFMVSAKTFKGPDADRWALALVLELRNEYHLPAYILRTRDFPMRSNIRNIPPTAIREMEKPYVGYPEKARTLDEAAVLVGNEKTLADQTALLHKVKKIKPKCLNGMPSIFHWRQGLSTAMGTTNPFVPAQDLFPRKPDPLVMKLNGGPHTVFRCPGHYTLQVAEFGGRASFDPKNDKQSMSHIVKDLVTNSPLEQAYDDAEALAERLAKDPEIRKAGYQPYVFHDRTASRVMIGAFNTPDDPAAAKLRETLLKQATSLMKKKTDTMIAPAPFLTDVEILKASAK